MASRQVGLFTNYFKSINVPAKRHGGELVAQVLKSHGVGHVFTLSGGHISPILVGAENLGIKVIDTRHEVTTVFAADAYARVSGIPGVAIVTAGPGLTNTVTAVKNAQMAESPVVLIGGCAATLLKGRGALQDIDHLSVFKSITKWQSTVNTVRDIVPTVREAFRQAQSGTPGPVLVEMPLDTLYPFEMVSKELIKPGGGHTMGAKMTNTYLEAHLKNLFAEAFDREHDTSPLALDIPTPKSSQVKEVAAMLLKAKNPLILLGSQSQLPPFGGDKLRSIIENLGIPVYLGGMSRGLLGRNGKLHIRQDRKSALKEADVVILGGVPADFRLNYGRSLSSSSKIVSINRSQDQMLKNAKFFWNPTVAAQCDVGSFFSDLLTELQSASYEAPRDWLDKLRKRDVDKENANKGKADKKADQFLNPVKVLHDLDEVFPDNSYLIADGGDFVATASYIVRPRGPLRWLDPGAFGTLGCGAGFALGVKCAKPDADVVCIFGDGSVGYSLSEFDTFQRHKLPVTAIVGNDACWTQIAREQKPVLGSDVACRLEYTRYDKAAEGLGAVGMFANSDSDDLKEMFNKALKINRKDKKPVLFNILIGKTDFREGSLSV
ncbi:Acetolactate synthase large subunit IlvG [Halotydeus destructor]|nr:Acetolactate synthase large subunit IlvG [Halotydeus destructor]